MLDHCRANLFATPVHELNDFVRQASLEENLDQNRPGVRNVFGRLEDHRIATHQRWKHFPGRDRHREVERADETGNTERPAIAHRPFIPQLTRNRLAKESAAFTRRVVGCVDPLLDVAAGLGKWLTHLPRHGVGDFFLAPGHDVSDRPQHITPGRRWSPMPAGKATFCALYGALDVAAIGKREFSDHVAAIGGISVVEVFTRFRGDPFPTNEVVELFHFLFVSDSFFRDCASTMLARKRVSGEASYAHAKGNSVRSSCKGSTAASRRRAPSPKRSSRTRA